MVQAAAAARRRRRTRARAVNDWERQVTAEPRRSTGRSAGSRRCCTRRAKAALECARALVDGRRERRTCRTRTDITPLIMAIDNCHFDIAAYLIEAGANPNKWDWWGRTPLYMAVDMNTLPHGGRAGPAVDGPHHEPRDRRAAAREGREPERAAEDAAAVPARRRRSRLRRACSRWARRRCCAPRRPSTSRR